MGVMADGSVPGPGEWLHDVAPGSSGRVRVHLSPDWLVELPVEVVDAGQPGYLEAEMLGISDGLARDLVAFQAWWEEHTGLDDVVEGEIDANPDWAAWDREGWDLVVRLQTELGPRYEVVWIGRESPET